MMLPQEALSVRQPWAWAVVMGFKPIENRSAFAVSKGNIQPRRICIHASKGMTRAEYEDARAFMADLGVDCPRPAELVRGAIIGVVTVTAVVKKSDSPWFVGPRGLVLADATPIEPVPAIGALGYFGWKPGGEIEAPLPWMLAWHPRHVPGQQEGLPLFGRSVS